MADIARILAGVFGGEGVTGQLSKNLQTQDLLRAGLQQELGSKAIQSLFSGQAPKTEAEIIGSGGLRAQQLLSGKKQISDITRAKSKEEVLLDQGSEILKKAESGKALSLTDKFKLNSISGQLGVEISGLDSEEISNLKPSNESPEQEIKKTIQISTKKPKDKDQLNDKLVRVKSTIQTLPELHNKLSGTTLVRFGKELVEDKTGLISRVDPDLASFELARKTIGQFFAKSLEGGRLSDQDRMFYLQLMPRAGDTREVIQVKVQTLNSVLDAAMGTKDDSARDDILQQARNELLNRWKKANPDLGLKELEEKIKSDPRSLNFLNQRVLELKGQ